MKATLHKTPLGWIARWSDLHSFTHGWLMNDTLLHPDHQSSTELEDGKEVEIDLEYGKGFSDSWARITPVKPANTKIVKTGFAQAMDGTDLWINTTTDEKITINLKDDRLRWDLYCKHVRITIEVIDESEV